MLDLLGSRTDRSIQSRCRSHADREVSRALGAVGLASRPWRSSITCTSSDTSSATATGEFFSYFTQNRSISSLQLFKLAKLISRRDMPPPICNRLSFLKLSSSGWSVQVWLICIKILTMRYHFTSISFFVLFRVSLNPLNQPYGRRNLKPGLSDFHLLI